MARAQLERYQTLVILLTLCAAAPAHSGPGDLDVRFGTHGQTEVPGQVDSATLIPLPDGRILVFGIPEDEAARAAGSIAVARLLANGEPDPTFGPGGHIDVPLGSRRNIPVPTDALLLADGRVLVAGYFRGTENEWFEWPLISSAAGPQAGSSGFHPMRRSIQPSVSAASRARASTASTVSRSRRRRCRRGNPWVSPAT